MGQYFLIMVDTHSKWPEVIPMSVTTAKTTKREMRKIFAVHGLPVKWNKTYSLSAIPSGHEWGSRTVHSNFQKCIEVSQV